MFWNIGKLAIHPRKALSMMMKINIKIWEAGRARGLSNGLEVLCVLKKCPHSEKLNYCFRGFEEKKVECFVVTHICWHVDTQFVERQQVMIFVSCFNDPCSTLGFGDCRESLCYVNYVSSPKQKCALIGPNIQLYPKQKHYNDKKLIFPIALFHSFPTVALFWQRARGSQTLNLPDCSDLWRPVSNSINCISSALLAKSSSNTSSYQLAAALRTSF